MGEQALKFFAQLYEVERQVQQLNPHERQAVKQTRSRPLADALRQWLVQQRKAVPDGSGHRLLAQPLIGRAKPLPQRQAARE